MAALAEFELIRSEADGQAYPREILSECRDALVLFAAGFLGRQDAFWIADAGLNAVCVDYRHEALADMQELYPAEWVFLQADIYRQPRHWETEADLVSVDCPSGHFERCADLVGLWTQMARKYVVLGTGADVEIEVPAGWRLNERRFRSDFAGGTYWAVLERT